MPILPSSVAIGLDIGGTKLSAARVSLDGGITNFHKTETPTQGQAFVDAITELVLPLLSMPGPAPVCLGIASAGTINSDTGDIFGATGNLPALRDIGSLKAMLEARLKIPVHLENDANAAVYGEARMGAAKGAADVLMITLGTGVGGGFLVQDTLVRGAHFAGAEVGHIAISMAHERLCTCGRWDCWETYASGTAVAETARRELRAAPNAGNSLILKAAGQIDAVTTPDVIAAYRGGDFIARDALRQWHAHVAIGLGSLINVLDPSITIVGGGMAQFVDFDVLRTLVAERSMTGKAIIEPAALGNEAGIMGAALLGLERLERVAA